MAETRFAQDLSHVPARAPASPASGGQALPLSVRNRFEDRFQSPLASVRIHDDFGAARMAKQNHANAMTVGENIYFGKGRYQPHDLQGQRLLAHELTHVIQQRTPGPASSISASEGEAHEMAEKSLTEARLPRVRHHADATHSAPMLNKSKAREVIEDELDDIFRNIKNAWKHIRKATEAERDEILADKKMEGKIRGISSPMELLKTYLLLNYGTEDLFPAHFKAFIKATDMWGTHEARIYAILRGVTQDERKEMREMPGLAAVIKDEMSGGELKKALRLLNEDEKSFHDATVKERSSTHLEIDHRYELELAARKDFETAEYAIKEVVNRSNAGSERSDVILNDTSLWAQFADAYDGEEVWYLRMLARYKKEANFPKADKQAEPFVKVIWEAVKPTGTDEDKLIKGLEDVNNSTTLTGGGGRGLKAPPREEVKDDPWFVPMLKSELSGKDLKRALNAVSATASAKAGIRDALENAIDKKDMKRIRELLTDPKLSNDDRKKLQDDPVILDEMGEELNGIQLCETTQLLANGAGVRQHIKDLLAFFQKTPKDIAGAAAYLTNLSDGEQDRMRKEPGVHYMLVDSKEAYLRDEDRNKLLAAVRSKDPAWQVPGSEGTHREHPENVNTTTDLRVSLTGSEARIQVRLNIVPVDSPPAKVSSGVIEDWTREIDKRWNNKFRLRSVDKRLSLVFDPYIAPGIAPPNNTLEVEDKQGRSFVRGPMMHLYLKGQLGEDELPPLTVAHEFGHLLGNPDEYNLTPKDYLDLTGKPGSKPRGGESVKGLMGSNDKSKKIEKRHAEPALDAVNVAAFPDVYSIEKA